jgi:hypothetical protein
MTRPRIRRLGVLEDAMIRVAATALGLEASRRCFGESLLSRPLHEHLWLKSLIVAAAPRLMYFSPVLASWTVALLVLQLRQPRPLIRLLARYPGWVGSCAAVTGLVIGYELIALKRARGFGGWQLVEISVLPVGVAVAAAWVNLAVSG